MDAVEPPMIPPLSPATGGSARQHARVARDAWRTVEAAVAQAMQGFHSPGRDAKASKNATTTRARTRATHSRPPSPSNEDEPVPKRPRRSTCTRRASRAARAAFAEPFATVDVNQDDIPAHGEAHARPNSCDICGRQFTRKWQMTRHRRTHTGTLSGRRGGGGGRRAHCAKRVLHTAHKSTFSARRFAWSSSPPTHMHSGLSA